MTSVASTTDVEDQNHQDHQARDEDLDTEPPTPKTSPSVLSPCATVPASLIFFISNIKTLIRTKLDITNYQTWKTLCEAALKANNLFDFVTGKVPCPDPIDPTYKYGINPKYQEWMMINSHLLCSLFATLTPVTLTIVKDQVLVTQVWLKLQQKFTVFSLSQVHNLIKTLRNTKKGNKSMHAYLEECKNVLDQLALSGHPLSDEAAILQILENLPSEYTQLSCTIRTRPGIITLEDCFAILKSEDLHINPTPTSQEGQVDTNIETTVALQAFKNQYSSGQQWKTYNNYNRGRGNRGSRRYRGTGNNFNRGNQSSNDSVICQICEKPNHSAKECWHRIPNTQKPNQPQAHSAFTNPYQPPNPFIENHNDWLLDSGATNHITNDINNFNSFQPYCGNSQVQVGNGANLPIQNTGKGSLLINQATFNLSKMLHVPQISTNLLSVLQFTKDNNCLLIFDSTGFQV